MRKSQLQFIHKLNLNQSIEYGLQTFLLIKWDYLKVFYPVDFVHLIKRSIVDYN